MKPDHLKYPYKIPLEREFEGWIVAGIDRYFRRIGRRHMIFALGMRDENVTGADEFLGFDAKCVGLQFKRPFLYEVDVLDDAKNFGWNLKSANKGKNSLRQYHNILSRPDVFYCLPTFRNSDYRRQALDHCVFWRPTVLYPQNTGAWYHKELGKKIHGPLKDKMRWGRFVESILECNIGLVLNADQDTPSKAVGALQAAIDKKMKGKLARAKASNELGADGEISRLGGTTYALIVELGREGAKQKVAARPAASVVDTI